MNVKAITFRRGGTIIADLLEEGENVKFSRPVETILNKTEDGEFYMTFIPFLHFTEESKTGISVPKEDIMTINTPIQQVINHYHSAFENKDDRIIHN